MRRSAWRTAAVIAVLIASVRENGSPSAGDAALDPLVIAVLPFEPPGQDPPPGAMQMGLAEILVVRLSHVPGLKVVPLSAVMEQGPPPLDAAPAGRALGAMSVMTGSFRMEGGAPRASVRLIDVETGAVAWTHESLARVKDPTAFEEAVAREVMERLFQQPLARPRPSPGPAETPTARYLRLVGSGSLASLDGDAAKESIALLETALRSSPASASINAALAEGCAGIYLGGVSADTAWLDRAEALARRAVWLDADLADGHLALGRAQRMQGEGVAAARSAAQALARDPAGGRALRLLGIVAAGVEDTALLHALRDRIARLSPSTDARWLDVILAIREGSVTSLLQRIRSDLDAAQQAGANAEMELSYFGVLSVEARDAAGALHAAAQLEGGGRTSSFADSLRLRALAQRGDVAGLKRIVDANWGVYTGQDDQALWVAQAWAEAGRRAETLEWIDRAVRLGTADAWTLEKSPALDFVRSDPRFERAASTVGARAASIQRIVRQALHP